MKLLIDFYKKYLPANVMRSLQLTVTLIILFYINKWLEYAYSFSGISEVVMMVIAMVVIFFVILINIHWWE